MGEINQITGSAPVPFVIGDKTYLLSHPTKRIQAQFESWLEGRVLTKAEAFRSKLGSDYMAFLAEVNTKIAEGHYSFYSKGASESLMSFSGGVYFIYLLLKDNQPSITLDQCEEIMTSHAKEMDLVVARMLGKKAQPQQQEIINE